MVSWVRDHLQIPLPSVWTARSKLCPSPEGEWLKIMSQLDNLAERTLKKVRKRPKGTPKSVEQICVNEKAYDAAWRRWKWHHPNSICIDVVQEKLPKFVPFVVCPVDKYNVDGVLICPLQWSRAVQRLASGLTVVPDEQMNIIFQTMFRKGQMFDELPFCSLRKAIEHEFGSLRAWPKKRTLDFDKLTSWSEIAWRPLVSYLRNHWRVLIGLAGRWCSCSVKELGWGWSVTSPLEATRKVDMFNKLDQNRPLALRRTRPQRQTIPIPDNQPQATSSSSTTNPIPTPVRPIPQHPLDKFLKNKRWRASQASGAYYGTSNTGDLATPSADPAMQQTNRFLGETTTTTNCKTTQAQPIPHEAQPLDPIFTRYYDLKDFFPNVDVKVLSTDVDRALREIWRRNPKFRYF